MYMLVHVYLGVPMHRGTQKKYLAGHVGAHARKSRRARTANIESALEVCQWAGAGNYRQRTSDSG